jgi:hypothetical protein
LDRRKEHSILERLLTMDDFVTVGTYLSNAEVEPLRLALEAAGIPAMATDENIGEMLTPLVFGGIKLQGAAKDAERAKEGLAELDVEYPPATQEGDDADSDNSGDGISLKCPACGADIWFPSDRRGQVETCPECGGQVEVEGDE